MRSTIIAVFVAALVLGLGAGAQAGTITHGPTLHDNGGPPFYLGYKVGTFDVPRFLASSPGDILTSVLLRVKVESYDGKHELDNESWSWSGSVTLGIGAYVGVQGPIPVGGSRLTVDSRATETATGSVTTDSEGLPADFIGPDSFSITGHYAADTKADSRTAALDLAPYIGAGDVTFEFTGGTSTYGTGPLPDGWIRVTAPEYKFTTTVEYTYTPEPATLSLLALGGLALLRRRKRLA
jgi:hypothetical protein